MVNDGKFNFFQLLILTEEITFIHIHIFGHSLYNKAI